MYHIMACGLASVKTYIIVHVLRLNVLINKEYLIDFAQ